MTNRPRIANVLSLRESTTGKKERRRIKATSTGRDLQPYKDPQARKDESRLVKRPDSVSIAERARSDLATMEDAALFSPEQLEALGIVHPGSRNRALVDALRQLRTKLYSLRPVGNFSVLVSSVLPQGGGSFVALNLAAAIAFDQEKTSLLLDANLHDPSLHDLLARIGIKNAPGLLDYLEKPSIGVKPIVNPSGIKRMRIIPTGQQRDAVAEHFTSAQCAQLMRDIKNRYANRYVVVDGPAMTTSADARILSDMCDYTVLVIPYGGVTPGVLDSVIDEIDESKLAGIVMNNQPD